MDDRQPTHSHISAVGAQEECVQCAIKQLINICDRIVYMFRVHSILQRCEIRLKPTAELSGDSTGDAKGSNSGNIL